MQVHRSFGNEDRPRLCKTGGELSASKETYGEVLFEVMTSSLPDAISDFNSSLYFAPVEELKFYYEEEYKLA